MTAMPVYNYFDISSGNFDKNSTKQGRTSISQLVEWTLTEVKLLAKFWCIAGHQDLKETSLVLIWS